MLSLLFRGESIEVREHALTRFYERLCQLDPTPPREPGRILESLQKLLAKAELDKNISRGHIVERIINNGFVSAKYFINSGWRFVIVKEGTALVLVTVERVSK